MIKKRGPKPKAEMEKKVPVKIWVKKKYYKPAKIECDAIERKFTAIEGQ